MHANENFHFLLNSLETLLKKNYTQQLKESHESNKFLTYYNVIIKKEFIVINIYIRNILSG